VHVVGFTIRIGSQDHNNKALCVHAFVSHLNFRISKRIFRKLDVTVMPLRAIHILYFLSV